MCNEHQETKRPYDALHNHSEFSILDGYAKIKDYVDVALKQGSRGLGLTDHGSTAGLYELITECNAAGIKPVPGFEAYVAPENPEGAFHKGPIFYGPNGNKAPKYDVGGNGSCLHITLFAYNSTGLKNILKLTSLAWERERFYSKPRIDTDLLFEYSEGIIVTTGCPSSEVSTRFLLGQDDKAYEYASRLKSVFGENMYVEVMDHSMKGEELERILQPKLVKMAKDLDIPLLATNDCHYVYKSDAEGHERMLALQTGMKMDEPTFNEGGRRFAFSGPEYYMKSQEEMEALFPEDVYPNALTNTNKVVDKCEPMTLDYDPHLRPEIDIPEGYTPVTYFQKLIQEGFVAKRSADSEEVQLESKKRIKHEFEVIHSNDFISYFLVVHDYIKFAHDNNIPTGSGRGCFLPDSEVTLANGSIKNIQDVEKGDIALLFDLNASPVTNTFTYDVVDEEITVITLSNGKVIKCTGDHQILTVSNGYIRADEVNLDTLIVGPNDGTFSGNNISYGDDSGISYPYTATFTPDGKDEELTFNSPGLHRIVSMLEASDYRYLLTKLTIDLNGKPFPLDGVTLVDNTLNQYMIAVAPDDVMTESPVVHFEEGDMSVILMSESATFSIFFNSELENMPIEVSSIEKIKYTGKVHDLEVGGYNNYIVSGAVVHNSVGGSEIAYVLDISDTDPIRFDLLFERFLSPGRGSVYMIEYEDGTKEEISVSETREVVQPDGSVVKKYIHELEDGDEVL